MTESAAVAPEGLTTPQDVERRVAGCVDTDRRVRPQPGCRDGDPQLAHARCDARCIAASPASQKATSSPLTRAGRWWDRRLSPTPVRPVPHALTIEEIGGVVQAFVDAARRSDRAGSTSLRFTPPMAICCTSSSRRCRSCAPTGTGVISPGGPGCCSRWSTRSARRGRSSVLAGHGVDLVDVSSGGLLPASIEVAPGYQVPFARSVQGGRSQDRRGGDAGCGASG